ncbi:acyl-CoA synthetase [Pseudahrensia aquimaris]|uniref:Acyl-CoA synthetase n=1 Tax=Pseudahrensia aquimaris TaxID=744461 RepID=A0ABW3FDU6_9HYPH
MSVVQQREDNRRMEAEMPASQRWSAKTIYQRLQQTVAAHGSRNACSFQLKSGPTDKAQTLTWAQLADQTTRAANLFRSLGIGETDTIAYMLPTMNETIITLMGGMTAGIVSPLNPLLDDDHLAGILRESNASVLVTLKSFPKTDLAQKAAAAVAMAPNVKTIIEIDLRNHLSPPLSWIIPFIRPKVDASHNAKVIGWDEALAAQSGETLSFKESEEDRFCAYFHTGGTTGMPKLAQHKFSGILYNGWCGDELLYSAEDVVLCPLPMFHVFAAYPIWLGCLTSGAHIVLPTPQGYRGDDVFDNFWKLVERWKATFLVTVPTAAAALLQRPVNADVSSLKLAFSGSAAFPQETFKAFQKATGVQILEGYGMTEATCLVSVNPVVGEKKIGSVGVPLPYTDVKIYHCDASGAVTHECGTDEVGEICVSNPGVMVGETYTDESKNKNLYANGKYLRTGDLGRIDADGYIWITGRAKDLIIRGGHNIDPAMIEEALSGHPAVAFVGAIGQPDAKAGELPCAYVELNAGATATPEELIAYCDEHVAEQAATPKYIEILDELPKTAVGKVFKPDLRRLAITRTYNAALEEAGVAAKVTSVIEDKKRGLVAKVAKSDASTSDDAINNVLGAFTRPWEAA